MLKKDDGQRLAKTILVRQVNVKEAFWRSLHDGEGSYYFVVR